MTNGSVTRNVITAAHCPASSDPPNSITSDETTIFLEGLIDTNGQMKGLQVLQPADPDFARAAMDAVNQWQFEPTLLHGVPVDTAIRITVGFTR